MNSTWIKTGDKTGPGLFDELGCRLEIALRSKLGALLGRPLGLEPGIPLGRELRSELGGGGILDPHLDYHLECSWVRNWGYISVHHLGQTS